MAEPMTLRDEDVGRIGETLTWMIGVGFVVVTSLTTLFSPCSPEPSPGAVTRG